MCLEFARAFDIPHSQSSCVKLLGHQRSEKCASQARGLPFSQEDLLKQLEEYKVPCYIVRNKVDQAAGTPKAVPRDVGMGQSKPPGEPQVLVHVSICQDSILGAYS